MFTLRLAITTLIGLTLLGLLVWLGREPLSAPATALHNGNGGTTSSEVHGLRLGLIPERDIFAQRARHRVLADYLQEKLGEPVELVTMASYEDVLEDLRDGRVDAAFLGSMVAVLAVDRLDARILVKAQRPGGEETYRGVIVVPEGSEIRGIGDLGGHTMAMIRTTMAGDLFPMSELRAAGLLGSEREPKFAWVGTHDDVLFEVAEKRVDAGALKDVRLEELLKEHPEIKVRRLATSAAAPDNALVVRTEVAEELGPKLREVLLGMDREERGRSVLKAYGAGRFVPCSIGEYGAIFDMADRLGKVGWERARMVGPAPRRPVTTPGIGVPSSRFPVPGSPIGSMPGSMPVGATTEASGGGRG